jgi:hypothetical protein
LTATRLIDLRIRPPDFLWFFLTKNPVTPFTRVTHYGRNRYLVGGNVLNWLKNGAIIWINVKVIAFMKETNERLSVKIDSLLGSGMP